MFLALALPRTKGITPTLPRELYEIYFSIDEHEDLFFARIKRGFSITFPFCTMTSPYHYNHKITIAQ